MSIKSEFNEQLEAYFNGNMQGADRLVFEGRVESDPMLKAEFEHQKEIIDSLKAQRTSELKTRLSNIAVEPTLIGSLLQNSLVKPIGYVVTGITVLTGSYLFVSQPSDIEQYTLRSMESKGQFLTASNLEINRNPSLDFRYVASKRPVTLLPPVEEKMVAEESQVINQVNEIVFEVPEIGTEMAADEFKAPNLEIEEAKKIEEVPTVAKMDKIQINAVHSRKYNFHYRIEDNRLFLYGKFNESPYEIIELNTTTTKKLFFFYHGSFYNLNKEANTITPLSRIDDTRLAQKLDVLRSSTGQ